jgi:hypothetical protein
VGALPEPENLWDGQLCFYCFGCKNLFKFIFALAFKKQKRFGPLKQAIRLVSVLQSKQTANTKTFGSPSSVTSLSPMFLIAI